LFAIVSFCHCRGSEVEAPGGRLRDRIDAPICGYRPQRYLRVARYPGRSVETSVLPCFLPISMPRDTATTRTALSSGRSKTIALACAYRLCHPNVLPMETAEPSN
jgi:hypothetical protein